MPISGALPPASGVPPIEPGSPRNAIILAALVVTCVAVVYLSPLREYVDEIESGVRSEWLHELRTRADAAGVAAAITFISGGSVGVAVGIPRLAVAFVAGAVFGWIEGTVLAQIATILGCWATFAIGRGLGHGWVDGIVARRLPRAKALLDFISRNEFVANLVLRLTPVGNSFATNLLFSVSSASPRTFLAATFLGAFPGTAVAALLGSAAKGTELASRLVGGTLSLVAISVGAAWWIRHLRGREG